MSYRTMVGTRCCSAPNAFNTRLALRATLFPHESTSGPKRSNATRHSSSLPSIEDEKAWNEGTDKTQASSGGVHRGQWPGSYENLPRINKQDRMAHLIQHDSLSATLEAHREWNRKRDHLRDNYKKWKREHGSDPSTGYVMVRPSSMFKRRSDLTFSPSSHPHAEPRRISGSTSESKIPAVEVPSKNGDGEFDYLAMRQLMLKIGETRSAMAREENPNATIIPSEFDYTPLVVPPRPVMDLTTNKTAPPWALSPQERTTLANTDALSEEIERFAAHMEPTETEKAARQAIADQVLAALKTFLSETNSHDKYHASVFGSQANGLALPYSDIDMRVVVKHTVRHEADGRMNFPIETFSAWFKKHSEDFILIKLHVAGFARGVMSMQHKATGLDVQIVSSAKTFDHKGEPRKDHSLLVQRDRVRQYLTQLPQLQKLYKVMKVFFGMRQLDNPFSGGVNAYTTFMMIVAALNRHPQIREASVGAQLMHVLEFYATFPSSRYGLSVESARPFVKHLEKDYPAKRFATCAAQRGSLVRSGQWMICRHNALQPYTLTLQDPADRRNNLGRSGSAWKHIKKTLESLVVGLKKPQREVFARERAPMLAPIVGECHEFYKPLRERLVQYAKDNLNRGEIGEEKGASTGGSMAAAGSWRKGRGGMSGMSMGQFGFVLGEKMAWHQRNFPEEYESAEITIENHAEK